MVSCFGLLLSLFLISVNAEQICGFTPVNEGDIWIYEGKEVLSAGVGHRKGFENLTKTVEIIDIVRTDSSIQIDFSVKDSGLYQDIYNYDEEFSYEKDSVSFYTKSCTIINGEVQDSEYSFLFSHLCIERDSCDGAIEFEEDTLLYSNGLDSDTYSYLYIERFGLIHYKGSFTSSHGNGFDDEIKLIKHNDKSINSDSLKYLVTHKTSVTQNSKRKNRLSRFRNVSVCRRNGGFEVFNTGRINMTVEIFDLKGSLLQKTELAANSSVCFGNIKKGLYLVRLNRNSAQSLKIQL